MNYDAPSERDTRSLRNYGLALMLPYVLVYLAAMIFSSFTADMASQLYIGAYAHFIIAAYIVVYFIFVCIKLIPYNISAFKAARWPPPNSRAMYKYVVHTGIRAKVYSVFCCLALVLFLLVLAISQFQKGQDLLFGADALNRLAHEI
jgi:hypothetical protein